MKGKFHLQPAQPLNLRADFQAKVVHESWALLDVTRALFLYRQN